MLVYVVAIGIGIGIGTGLLFAIAGKVTTAARRPNLPVGQNQGSIELFRK